MEANHFRKDKQPPPARFAKWPLLLILFVFTLLTLYNTFLLPLGEADDETDHYQYLQFVAQTGHPPLTAGQRDEAGFKGGLAPLYYWLSAWPLALAGEDSQPEVRRVNARPERHIPTDGLGLNHVMHTLDEAWPWQGQILAWHLVRLLSLPMGWVTIMATYALARRLQPAHPGVALGAAAFVALLPRFVISSAVINDDNLVFALTGLLVLIQVVILQGNRRPLLFALLGALFGLALLTKYFSLILFPEVILTLFASYAAGSKVAPGRRHFAGLLAFLGALLLIAGPWFTFIILRFNRIDTLGLIPGLAASLGEPQITEGLAGLISGQPVRPPAVTYSPLEWLGLIYRSFWFEYGWMRLFGPAWIYGLYTIFLGLAVVGLGQQYRRRRSVLAASGPPGDSARFIPWLLGLHLGLFFVVVLARYILSATLDTGQGRHLYPALPVIAWLIALGMRQLLLAPPAFPQSSRPGSLLPALFYLVITTCYLLPSLISLQPALFILPHYRFLPVTITPPDQLPILYPQSLSFGKGLSLAGLSLTDRVAAGETLPVTLYWQAEQEAGQDYLLSICLQNRAGQPVACWRGPFAGGHYPPRAWEAGDTIIDTVFIPAPTCYRLSSAATYSLQLTIWPVESDSPKLTPAERPVLEHTFAEPAVTLQPTDSLLKSYPQTVDFWQANARQTGRTTLALRETVTQITYATHSDQTLPRLEAASQTDLWLPLTPLQTPLYFPCDEGPAPFVTYLAPFIANPTLSPGLYRPEMTNLTSPPTFYVELRSRRLAPIESELTFGGELAPLSLGLPGQPEIDLSKLSQTDSPVRFTGPPSSLPVTIRWQARRWMAEPLIVSLKLLDKEFAIGGERSARLGDRYPNVLWAPTERVEETYVVPIRPDAPPGLYRLELSLIHQDKDLADGFEFLPVTDGQTDLGPNLYPATIRLPDPAFDTPPAHPISAQLGRSIQLTGYDLEATESPSQSVPQTLNLALYWQSTAEISTDYTVFVQLVGPDGQVWAQWDNPPQAGRYPTPVWSANDTIVDRYTLTLREGAPPGEYRLLVGMYDPTTGQRLPVTVKGQSQPEQALELTTLLY